MNSNIRILIVDSDEVFVKNIKTKINKMGYYSINIATTYKKAIYYIQKNTPDLILLDINSGDKYYNGIDLANEKSVLNRIPVIYLTEDIIDTKIEEKIIATNPKNYLIKSVPFELIKIAIILALEHKHGNIYIGYNFSYNLNNKILIHGDKVIKLSLHEDIILEKLIEYRGEIIPKNVLEFEVWGNEVVSKSSLRTQICNLRKKLHSDMIKTVLSIGYKLILPDDEINP